MGETIIDGRGNWIAGSSDYIAGVTQDNRLMVDASVSVSAGSNSYIFGKSGANYYPLLSTSGTDGGLLRVDSSVSVSTGSEVFNFIQSGNGAWIAEPEFRSIIGSVNISNDLTKIGSYTIQFISGIVTQGAGHNGGAFQPWSISGTVSQGIAGNDPWNIQGSLRLADPASVGSYTIQFISGNVGISGIINQGTNPWVISGIVNLGSVWGGTGSVYLINSLTTTSATDYKISGTHTGIGSAVLVAGDYGGSVWPIRIFGGSYVMVVGSISSIPNISASSSSDYKISGTWQGIGSGALVAGDFNGSVYPIKMIGGSQVLITGSVNQGTTPWGVSGTIGMYGYANGSIIRQSVGSPSVYFNLGTTRQAFMIDNVGSSPIYFMIGSFTISNINGGSVAFLSNQSFRSFDLQTGGISAIGSGLTSPQVQVIAIH